MTIKLIKMDNVAEAILEGRLDSSSAPETERVLKEAAERFDKLTLNLMNLEYTSSAGLRVLKQLHFFMKKKDGQLVMKNVNKPVMEVFEMTGFVGVLKFE